MTAARAKRRSAGVSDVVSRAASSARSEAGSDAFSARERGDVVRAHVDDALAGLQALPEGGLAGQVTANPRFKVD